jgi:excinuclease ABC subunit A
MVYRRTPEFYGVEGFFDWLQTKAYKMHVRVLLSRYRAYRTCGACGGSRFRPETHHYRIDGENIGDLYRMPVGDCADFLDGLRLAGAKRAATEILVAEIRSRLGYLKDVGLGYLTLDRQSRTLSGGEVERVSLTRALGSALVNTLYVLDEPSIGLHARDMERLIRILYRIRSRRNTVVVIEHDRDMIEAADYLVDLGPAAGASGGHLVFKGPFREVLKSKKSVTGKYLSGREKIALPPKRRPPADRRIVIAGATAHNLKNVTVDIPLGRFVCISGVSGSGKSTLMQDVLYNHLIRLRGRPADQAGACEEIRGAEQLGDVIFVDQAPIGATSRANPATYTRVFNAVRTCFAKTEEARIKNLPPGAFSFNSDQGRCGHCGGSGSEKIEMQFLADIYLKCPVCRGKRFREDILEVTYRGRTIADVLDMTADEAGAFFEAREVRRGLDALRKVGLGYLPLGQPLNTLSGGEAQRLKLAGHLIKAGQNNVLFLFDEPTTGLHLDDIRRLLETFDHLVSAGNSLLVIEHNLEVLKSADHIIDLGPEGGDRGGRVIATGTPEEIARARVSHTGRCLRPYLNGKPVRAGKRRPAPAAEKPGGRAEKQKISIIGAREHNLKNISLDLPRNRFVAVTGVSGSGKSTLVFDILFAEGQRRYLDGLSAYIRKYLTEMPRPEVDHIEGIPPTVAIEQRRSRGGRKSTVATMTEIYHYLRLLYARAADQFCPKCRVPVEKLDPESVVQRAAAACRGRKKIKIYAPLVRARKGYYLEMAEWAAKKGFRVLRVDGRDRSLQGFTRLSRYQDHDIDLLVGDVPRGRGKTEALRGLLFRALDLGRGSLIVARQGEKDRYFSTARVCPDCGRAFPEPDPRMFSFNSTLGACPACHGLGVTADPDEEKDDAWKAPDDHFRPSGPDAGPPDVCPDCRGARLNRVPLAFKISGLSIADFTALPASEACRAVAAFTFDPAREGLAAPIVKEIEERLRFLLKVGLGYLPLNRSADTLAGGESQRLRLAAQLGSTLSGVCYILDEPTIGLHPRDNGLLLDALAGLKARGNTVVVVEHDEETISRADYVIDLGPGPGLHGGDVVAQGGLPRFMKNKKSATARVLAEPMAHPLRGQRRPVAGTKKLRVFGAAAHNLKKIDIALPLARFVCISGVSGSGKSSLMFDVLYQGIRRENGWDGASAGPYRRMAGTAEIRRALHVDQAPIGRTPRSTPATFVKFFGRIRELFSLTPEARMRRYPPGRFSFNVRGGRCESCAGQGVQKMEMNFLPHVRVACDRCGGRRYTEETLEILYNGKSIADVLAMTVDESADFFRRVPAVAEPLKILSDIGLGYLTLGQTSPTLSGGEAQRVKLAAELARGLRNHTIYFLEEPSTGLHRSDIEHLLAVIHRIVDRGNTVVVIEHNLDILAESDYIIDLGPEGGDAGGTVVADGTPEEIMAARKTSYTGRFLHRFMNKGKRRA